MVKYRPVGVIGGVTDPGNHDYAPGMTIIEAISAAGGYTPDALNRWPPIVTRTADRTTTRQSASLADEVRPGDVIEVPVARSPGNINAMPGAWRPPEWWPFD